MKASGNYAPTRILLIDENADDRETTAAILHRVAPAAEIVEAGSGLEYTQNLCKGSYELAIAAASVSWGAGAEILDRVRQHIPACSTILLTETGSTSSSAVSPAHFACAKNAEGLAGLGRVVKRDLAGSGLAPSPPPSGETEPAVGSPLVHLAAEMVEVEKRAQTLLDNNALGSHPRQMVVEFLRATERLQAVIGHLGGKSNLPRDGAGSPVKLSDVVLEAMRGLQAQIHATNARVLAGRLPILTANPQDLIQIFHHLLDNAIRFRAHRPPHASIRAHQQAEHWIISVSDNGVGIGDVKGIDPFAMFTTLRQGDGRRGTGIGLAICRRIARSYDGDVWYESEPGTGSTFFVKLKTVAVRPERVELAVNYNGQPIGWITVSDAADKAEITRAALALPDLDRRLGEQTIKDVQLLGADIINIVG